MPGPAPTVYSPFSACGMPHAYSITSSPRWTSPLASAMTLPCSELSRCASSSMCASTSSLYLNITRARRCGLVAAQAGCAALAASTAFCRSDAVPRRTWAWTWPWLGSNTSPWRSPEAKLEPPMKWSMLRSMDMRPDLKVLGRGSPRPAPTQMPVAEAEERESRDAWFRRFVGPVADRRSAIAFAGREAARDHRSGQRRTAESDGRETGQLRHSAYAFVADRPEARNRRCAGLD